MYPGTYAAATPDKIAAIMTGTGETLTYGDLERRSVQLAHVLHDAGLRRGDVVALLTENNLRAFEVYLSPGPIYHAAPLRWSGSLQVLGATVVMTERFDAEQTLRAIQDHHVTHAQFVPTMFVRMLQLPPETRDKYDVSSLRIAIHAAAPCPVEVQQKMIEW